MRWHVWHRAPGTEMWCHETCTSRADAVRRLDHWVMSGHSAQIKEGSDDE